MRVGERSVAQRFRLRDARTPAKGVSESGSTTAARAAARADGMAPAPRAAPVFLHVPKAGGSTVIHALEWSYGKENVWRRTDPGWPMDLPGSDELPSGGATAYVGHMAYGLHRRLGVQAVYCSVVRDPVSRLSSAYHYIRRVQRNPLHSAVVEMSLADFARNPFGDIELDNGQLRRLHPDGDSIPLNCCALDHVWDIVDLIAGGGLVVGTSEQMVETLALFSQRLPGLGVPAFLSQNVAGDSRPEISWEERKLLVERNLFDVVLHQVVASLVRNALNDDRGVTAARDRIRRRSRYIHPLRTFPARLRAKARYEWARQRRIRGNPGTA